MEAWFASLLVWFALPKFGLATVFVVAFVSATLLPLGSEPALFGFIQLTPEMFWPGVLVATLGNTLGGALTWWMGYAAERAYEKVKHQEPPHARALDWLERFGPKACLLAWVPIIGDPLCGVAGWLKLPFWPCVLYMAIGKFARYLSLTTGMVWLWPILFPV